jgi:hypothetical protein
MKDQTNNCNGAMKSNAAPTPAAAATTGTEGQPAAAATSTAQPAAAVKFTIDGTKFNSTMCRDIITKAESDEELKKSLEEGWDKEDMGAGAGAAIGGAVGAVTGAGLSGAITYFVESNSIMCRIGDNTAQVAYEKSYKIPSLKEYYTLWDLKLVDSTSSNPLPIMNYSEWKTACGSIEINVDKSACEEAKVNYKRAGLTQGMQIYNACTWKGDNKSGTCGVNMTTCLSYGVCTLSDVAANK